MKSLTAVMAILLILTGCSREQLYPYHHATGTIKIDGTEYQSALIIQYHGSDIHVVGGFISNGLLPSITIGGPDNPQNTPLQIMPSQSSIVHNGQKYKIQENGHLIWFLDGKTYHQRLDGFPLEKDIHTPTDASVSKKTDVVSKVKIGATMEDVRALKGSPLRVESLPSEPWQPPKPDDMTEEEYIKRVEDSKNSTAKEYWVYSEIRVYFNFNNRVMEIRAAEK